MDFYQAQHKYRQKQLKFVFSSILKLIFVLFIFSSIYIRFGLPAKIPKSIELKIKKIDKALAWYEAISVGGYREEEAMQILKKPDLKHTNQEIVPLSPNSIAEKFLKKFNQILFQINQ